MFYRMTLNQRIQHTLGIFTFAFLVMTGLPLKFAGEPWALYIINMWGGAFAAGYIHRSAGVIMLIGVAYHLAYVGATSIAKLITIYQTYPPTGVGDFISKLLKFVYQLPICPRVQDGTDIVDFIKYALFITNKKPQYTKWSWKEKFEYLAALAGDFIIGGTGLMLMFPTYAATVLPARAINIAWSVHTSEALLAAAVIFIWHFYNAIFCPEKFPMDHTVIDGCIPACDMIDEHVAEYRRCMFEGEDSPGLVKQLHHDEHH